MVLRKIGEAVGEEGLIQDEAMDVLELHASEPPSPAHLQSPARGPFVAEPRVPPTVENVRVNVFDRRGQMEGGRERSPIRPAKRSPYQRQWKRAGERARLRRETWERLQAARVRELYHAVQPRVILPPLAGCWNCGRLHHYAACPFPRQEFCYGCGIRGVTLRNCPRCSVVWRRRGAYVQELNANVPWQDSLSYIFNNCGRY